jgi:putative ABC transport system ATP-binding protein
MPEEMSSPTPGPALLEGRGIGRVYGKGKLATRVVHPSEVAIHAGEVVALAGPSGSGKTTLLSMLGLVLSPTEGEVWLERARVSDLSPDDLARVRLRSVGFVCQHFNLLQGLSALENVAMPLLLAKIGTAERRERALGALDQVGLASLANRKPRELSGGEQQRIAIARAVVTNPRIVLCDEPTASLDGASGQLVLDLLRDLASGAERAVVVVTHDERVIRIADRVIDVADGRIRERSILLKGSA